MINHQTYYPLPINITLGHRESTQPTIITQCKHNRIEALSTDWITGQIYLHPLGVLLKQGTQLKRTRMRDVVGCEVERYAVHEKVLHWELIHIIIAQIEGVQVPPR